MTVRWTVRAAPGPPAGGESLIARHVVADFTCSRRRFFVSQKTRHPCCGARLFRRSQRSLEKFDRGHSLASLFPPPAAVGSLPSFRRVKCLVYSIEWRASRAYLNSSFLIPHCPSCAPTSIPHFSFLIPHCPFLAPRPPCERGSNPRPARFAFFSPKGVSRFDI